MLLKSKEKIVLYCHFNSPHYQSNEAKNEIKELWEKRRLLFKKAISVLPMLHTQNARYISMLEWFRYSSSGILDFQLSQLTLYKSIEQRTSSSPCSLVAYIFRRMPFRRDRTHLSLVCRICMY